MKLTDMLEHLKEEVKAQEAELADREHKILVLRQKIASPHRAEPVTLGVSPSEQLSSNEQMKRIREMLELPVETSDLFEGIEQKLEELKYRCC